MLTRLEQLGLDEAVDGATGVGVRRDRVVVPRPGVAVVDRNPTVTTNGSLPGALFTLDLPSFPELATTVTPENQAASTSALTGFTSYDMALEVESERFATSML